ncbi:MULTISPECIES: DUF805 domain-containing protein [Corallincola]|uniref:DUF805 domain-containing protein n=3 Tax=Corallincola TaxID=1775176 RepID=A0A368NG09_9GAMM|nr:MULTISPECIES: DUF805 domain-containing protein [Corallincola]RCU49156.1 DUF805 domain-containing protein [Corallincola holothuriorum]TAA47531.1 DUF805 domain-containing protein [Corallincola spongiicola]TCI05215.1 DUF805 domain-containing protein [Corallincola luteus]
MSWFLAALKKYATFAGRARRCEYWYFALFYLLTVIVAVVIDAVIGIPIFTVVTMLGLIIPSISVTVRRLHDTGRSGWWYWIVLVPMVGGIILLIFMLIDSAEGENDFGPNPKVATAP